MKTLILFLFMQSWLFAQQNPEFKQYNGSDPFTVLRDTFDRDSEKIARETYIATHIEVVQHTSAGLESIFGLLLKGKIRNDTFETTYLFHVFEKSLGFQAVEKSDPLVLTLEVTNTHWQPIPYPNQVSSLDTVKVLNTLPVWKQLEPAEPLPDYTPVLNEPYQWKPNAMNISKAFFWPGLFMMLITVIGYVIKLFL